MSRLLTSMMLIVLCQKYQMKLSLFTDVCCKTVKWVVFPLNPTQHVCITCGRCGVLFPVYICLIDVVHSCFLMLTLSPWSSFSCAASHKNFPSLIPSILSAFVSFLLRLCASGQGMWGFHFCVHVVFVAWKNWHIFSSTTQAWACYKDRQLPREGGKAVVGLKPMDLVGGGKNE